jgi:hypothetical protein
MRPSLGRLSGSPLARIPHRRPAAAIPGGILGSTPIARIGFRMAVRGLPGGGLPARRSVVHGRFEGGSRQRATNGSLTTGTC